MKKCCDKPQYAGTKQFDICQNCGYLTHPPGLKISQDILIPSPGIDLGWDNFLEDLPKFEYVEGDPILADNLIKAFEEFVDTCNQTSAEDAINCIHKIEHGEELNNRQKHLVYYHMKDRELKFGEYKNEIVKEYFKNFVPDPLPWEK